MSKKKSEKDIGKIRGFSIRFLPYSEIRDLYSEERINKILKIVVGNNILILQGRLKPEEEAKLIGETMNMVGRIRGFKGIELAVVSGNGGESFFAKLRQNIINRLSKGDLSSLTIIGPATIVKEIKNNPKKIELFLNK